MRGQYGVIIERQDPGTAYPYLVIVRSIGQDLLQLEDIETQNKYRFGY